MLARFFAEDAVKDYKRAARIWQKAAADADRFDKDVEGYVKSHDAAKNDAVEDLKRNMEFKAYRAKSTLAGEAEEVRHWRIRDPSIIGPGGKKGIDIRLYQPLGGGRSKRGDIEIKTARSEKALFDGINKAYRTRPSEIHVRYTGEPFKRPASFVRDQATYHTRPLNDTTTGAVKVFVNGRNGTVDEFSVFR